MPGIRHGVAHLALALLWTSSAGAQETSPPPPVSQAPTTAEDKAEEASSPSPVSPKADSQPTAVEPTPSSDKAKPAPRPAPTARAKGGQRFSWSVTESLMADWHQGLPGQPGDEQVFDIRNRLNGRLRYGPWSGGLRLDTAWFAGEPSDPVFKNDIVNLQEIFVRYSAKGLTAALGDDYVSFGRGMALSLRKVDELGFDMTLRGAHARWKNRHIDVRLHSGLTNVANVDGVDEKKVPDPLDLISALRVEVRPGFSFSRGLRFGAHLVDVERRHSPALGSLSAVIPGGVDQGTQVFFGEQYIRSSIAGASVDAPRIGKVVSLYAEANVLRNENINPKGEQDVTDGLGIYGAVTAYAGPMTLLLEAKHYDGFAMSSSPHPDVHNNPSINTQTFTYIAPPTLERKDQRWANNEDVDGLHLQADYRLPDKMGRAFLSAAGFLHGTARDEVIGHIYGGWEGLAKSGHRLLAQAGWRTERRPDEDLIRKRLFHIDLDGSVLVAKGHDLQFHVAHMFWTTDLGLLIQDDYLEGTAYVTWSIAPHWSFTGQFEYLTSEGKEQPLFAGGIVQYRFTHDTFVRLFAGRSKGGLKCSGGVCRIFPDFEGARLEGTIRF